MAGAGAQFFRGRIADLGSPYWTGGSSGLPSSIRHRVGVQTLLFPEFENRRLNLPRDYTDLMFKMEHCRAAGLNGIILIFNVLEQPRLFH